MRQKAGHHRSPEAQPLRRARFIIGQDEREAWVLHDVQGTRGGLFVSQVAAYQFALREANHDPALVSIVGRSEIGDLAGSPPSERSCHAPG